MTMDRPVVELPAASAAEVAVPGDRLRRLRRRQKLVREELGAALFLFVLLAATVAVLVTQWLSTGPAAGAVAHLTFGGST